MEKKFDVTVGCQEIIPETIAFLQKGAVDIAPKVLEVLMRAHEMGSPLAPGTNQLALVSPELFGEKLPFPFPSLRLQGIKLGYAYVPLQPALRAVHQLDASDLIGGVRVGIEPLPDGDEKLYDLLFAWNTERQLPAVEALQTWEGILEGVNPHWLVGNQKILFSAPFQCLIE